MDPHIRLAAPDEGRLVADFRLRSTLERRGGDPAQFRDFLDECAAAFAAGIASEALRSWLALDGERAVGTATLQVWATLPRVGGRSARGAARDGRVRNVFVVPEFRQRGIARALVRAVLADAENLRVDRLTLGTSEMGRPLYASLGFVPKDDELVYFWS